MPKVSAKIALAVCSSRTLGWTLSREEAASGDEICPLGSSP